MAAPLGSAPTPLSRPFIYTHAPGVSSSGATPRTSSGTALAAAMGGPLTAGAVSLTQ